MTMVASCVSTVEGKSANQLMTWAAVCASDSTPRVMPPRYTANTMTTAAINSDRPARVRSPKSRVRRGAMSSMYGPESLLSSVAGLSGPLTAKLADRPSPEAIGRSVVEEVALSGRSSVVDCSCSVVMKWLPDACPCSVQFAVWFVTQRSSVVDAMGSRDSRDSRDSHRAYLSGRKRRAGWPHRCRWRGSEPSSERRFPGRRTAGR